MAWCAKIFANSSLIDFSQNYMGKGILGNFIAVPHPCNAENNIDGIDNDIKLSTLWNICRASSKPDRDECGNFSQDAHSLIHFAIC